MGCLTLLLVVLFGGVLFLAPVAPPSVGMLPPDAVVITAVPAAPATPAPDFTPTSVPTPIAPPIVVSGFGTGAYADVPVSRLPDGGYVLGSPDAPITIVEFSDFLCPHCQDYEQTIAPFIRDYVLTGQVRYEYRFFPVIDRVYSFLAAQLVECADTLRPGLFWEARDTMFQLASTGQADDRLLPNRLAVLLDLDADALGQCVNSAQQVFTDQQLGQSIGIAGTPSLRLRDAGGDLQVITFDGDSYDGGPVPLRVLRALVEAAQ